MPSTVRRLEPLTERRYAARCPGTKGKPSHIIFLNQPPIPGVTYRCKECYGLMQLDRIARDVSDSLQDEEKPERPYDPNQFSDRSVDDLLRGL